MLQSCSSVWKYCYKEVESHYSYNTYTFTVNTYQVSSGKSNARERSAATVVTYSRRTYLINSNRLSVSPSQSQLTEPFTENTMQYLGEHLKLACPIICSVVAYGHSRRGYIPKSRSSAIINYSSQISNSIF